MSHRSVKQLTTAATFAQSFRWVFGFPALVGASLVASPIALAGSFVGGPLSILSALPMLFVAGMAFLYTEAEVREKRASLELVAVKLATFRFVSLVAVSIFWNVVVGVGLAFLILPGVYLGARLGLAQPGTVIDGLGVLESLDRSWKIAPGNIPKLVGVVVLYDLVLAAGFVLGVVLGTTAQRPSLVIGLLVPFHALGWATVNIALARVYLENAPAPRQIPE